MLCKQFPLRPAGATTIHSAQGGTYKQIFIDMDISDSIGLQKNEHLAKLYLKHEHYVSASRVTTLERLQIINWNPHLISVNSDVKEHIEFMQKE